MAAGTSLDESLTNLEYLVQQSLKLQTLIKENFPKHGPIPELKGIQVHGDRRPIKSVGGDLLTYTSFPAIFNLDQMIEEARGNGKEDIVPNLKKLKTTAGITIADVAGHDEDAALHAMSLYGILKTQLHNELEQYGEITTHAFEVLNNVLLSSGKHVTMNYGEINENGRFRFVSMGHPPPLVYSLKYGKFVDINMDVQAQFLPLGLLPFDDQPDKGKSLAWGNRRRYRATDINLMGQGDILLLYSDGIYDGADDERRLGIEEVVSRHSQTSAKEICDAVMGYSIQYDKVMKAKDPEHDIDDKTLVVIKKE